MANREYFRLILVSYKNKAQNLHTEKTIDNKYLTTLLLSADLEKNLGGYKRMDIEIVARSGRNY
jgi:hypothetical protein